MITGCGPTLNRMADGLAPNLTIRKGSTWVRPMTFTDPTTGDPYVIADHGWTLARLQARSAWSDDTPVIDLDSADLGGIVIAGEVITVTLTSAQTTRLAPGAVVWDLELSKPNPIPDAPDIVWNVMRGTFDIGHEVTR